MRIGYSRAAQASGKPGGAFWISFWDEDAEVLAGVEQGKWALDVTPTIDDHMLRLRVRPWSIVDESQRGMHGCQITRKRNKKPALVFRCPNNRVPVNHFATLVILPEWVKWDEEEGHLDVAIPVSVMKPTRRTNGSSRGTCRSLNPKQEEALKLLASGKGSTEVAAQLGLDRQVVANWKQRHINKPTREQASSTKSDHGKPHTAPITRVTVDMDAFPPEVEEAAVLLDRLNKLMPSVPRDVRVHPLGNRIVLQQLRGPDGAMSWVEIGQAVAESV